MTPPPVLEMREWATVTPETPGAAMLRGLRLTNTDRVMVAELQAHSSLRFTELRGGLAVSVGPHIGTVNLSGVRLVIRPKLRFDQLLRMIAQAFDLTDLQVAERRPTEVPTGHGLIDLLGLALLRAVERIARGGLLPEFQARSEDLTSPRGRFDLRHIATHPRQAALRCAFDELLLDHPLNQTLAAGLRLAATVVQSADLRLALARAADRLLGDLHRCVLDGALLRTLLQGLDRRSSHYRTALTLIALIQQGACPGDAGVPGTPPLASFTLNMNLLFERFLGRYLREQAPADVRVNAQESRADVFWFLHNGGGWQAPRIRPDFVFRRRGAVLAVADAKYKNRHEHPPTAAELYQLCAYGLAYGMVESGEVLLLHPLVRGAPERPTTLLFAPPAIGAGVRIRLVGVPVDGLLDGSVRGWWPFRERSSS